MKNRRLLYISILQLLILTLAPKIQVSATNTATLKVDPQQYVAPVSHVNETFTINVSVSDIDIAVKLVGVQFRLCYNSTLLRVLNVSEGPFMRQAGATFFTHYVEVDGAYGPHILVGVMLPPNATGEWPGPFPQGNGTITTITFNATGQPTVEPEAAANFTFQIVDTMLVNDLGEKLLHNVTTTYYQIQPLKYPIAKFTYNPPLPSTGELVLFDASESYDPDYEISVYAWDFGDGTIDNTTEPVIGHVYSQQGTFVVTLTITDIDGLSANITKTISISYYEELTVSIDVGSIHFAGELADFYILVSDFGRPIDVTSIKAMLYYNGSLFADLTNITQYVSTGLYRIAYEIPSEAEPGTYALVVEVECYTVKGTNLKSFLVSQTLSGFVTDITQGIATVSNGLTEVKLNLTEINATLVDIEGNIGIIDSTVGTLKTDIANLNATILEVNGNIATISTTLGEVKTMLGDTQSTATTILYVTSTLSAIAVVLAAVILILQRKK